MIRQFKRIEVMKRTRAFTLKSYPFKEADRIVIFFTEDYGLISGVARGSLKMKSKISGALEPLTLVNLRFVEPHGKELVVVTGCDGVLSLFHKMADMQIAVAAGLIVELTMESHAERDEDTPYFRLLELSLKALREDVDPGIVMRYFELFTLKLMGVLPPPSELKVDSARELMQVMLRTNLFDIRQTNKEALSQLGNYLRRELRIALGKQLKSHAFIDQMKR
jgi:DNA repair protein RecO (recombination protein O)